MAFPKVDPRFAFVMALAATLCAGCSSSSSEAADATADYQASLPNEGDGGGTDAGDATTAPGTATIRVVHVSPDLGPVDFCWRIAGSATYSGPVLSRGTAAPPADGGSLADGPVEAEGAGDARSVSDARQNAADAHEDAAGAREDAADAREDVADARQDAADAEGDAEARLVDAAEEGGADAVTPASAPGLSFGEITSSVLLDAAGTFDIALVNAGAASCLNPKLVAQVTLDAGKHATIALVGLLAALDNDADMAQALSVVAFTDEADLELSNARVRLIHAALGATTTGGDAARQFEAAAPALAVDVESTDVAAEIDPRHASTASGMPAVDALGYSTVSPVSSGARMSFQGLGDAGGEVWSTSAQDFDLLAGSLHTGLIVSRPQGALAVVWCSDAATAVSTQPAPCQLFEAPRSPKP